MGTPMSVGTTKHVDLDQESAEFALGEASRAAYFGASNSVAAQGPSNSYQPLSRGES